jgi:hypothetical protein
MNLTDASIAELCRLYAELARLQPGLADFAQVVSAALQARDVDLLDLLGVFRAGGAGGALLVDHATGERFDVLVDGWSEQAAFATLPAGHLARYQVNDDAAA